tara:strand:- start:110 stop:478 length:369 start_codon:yes stop_codon:yes gene_type:complete
LITKWEIYSVDAVENTGFKPRPFRTEGIYSKYNSIDDKIDDLHYYITYIKLGLGRASYDVSQEIRSKHITREEGKALVKRFDELCDKFRSPHLWKKENGEWMLRHTVFSEDSKDLKNSDLRI